MGDKRPGHGGTKPGVSLRGSLLLKLALPVCIAVGVLAATIAAYLPTAIMHTVSADLLAQVEGSARQLQALRADEVARARPEGRSGAGSQGGALPSPEALVAGFIDRLQQNGAQVRLLAAVPPGTPRHADLDAFQRHAFRALEEDPAGAVLRVEPVEGREVLRVAVPTPGA